MVSSSSDLTSLTSDEVHSLLQSSRAQLPENFILTYLCYCELQKRAPKDPILLEDFGEFLANAQPLIGTYFQDQLELQQDAYKVLQTSVQQDPLGSSKKYMYLGQLDSGEKSLQWYQKGREILKPKLVQKNTEDVTRFCDLNSAIAELHMTDLCDRADAQDVIEQMLDEAVQLYPQHFDTRVQRAAYSLVIGDLEESASEANFALEVLRPFMNLIHLDFEEDTEMVEDADTECKKSVAWVDTEQELPNLDSQLQLARICTANGLVNKALIVLKFLLNQDEEDDRIWHRLALAHYAREEFAESLDCAKTALSLVKDSDEEGNAKEDGKTTALCALIRELETITKGSSE